MIEAKMKWTGGIRFEGISAFGHKIATDGVKKAGGNENGYTGPELVLFGLAGCTGVDVIKILEKMHPYPVSLEGPNNFYSLLEKAEEYNKWGENVVIKVPMLGNGDGLRAVSILNEIDIKTNVTACMTLNQTFLATCAGATYVSLFYNRMKDWWKSIHLERDDIGFKSKWVSPTNYALNVINATMQMIEDGDYETKLIVGSIRSVDDVEDILCSQPHIITLKPETLRQMPHNDMTEKTLIEFEKAWEKFCEAEKNVKKD